MNCENCRALLPEHLRSALAADLAAEVLSHLHNCPNCRAEHAALQHINALLDIETQPSAQLRQNFMARLQLLPPPRRVAELFRTWWPSRPIGAFSYSAALLLCGVIGGQWLPLVGPTSMAAAFGDNLGGDRLVQLCAVPPAAVELL